MKSTRLAVDVGGTFTDVVRLDDDGTLTFEKVPTTPAEPTRGVLDSFQRAEAPLDQAEIFTHGTTLGLNAFLTRTGARTAVVATHGFRDVYLLGRTARKGNYNITYSKPPALLERADTFEVRERMLFDGTIHAPFDEEDAHRVAVLIRDGGYQSVAVGFLHSYANPAHEMAMKQVLAEVAPDVEVSLSSDLSREYREYERTSTAVLDAYIKPVVRTYLGRLESQLEAGGFGGQFLMMRSGGGAMTASSAREQPVNLILSGPAGGVIGAAGFASLVDEPDLVTIDMGGTSLDASLVVGGRPVSYQDAEFEDLPINISSLYIHTIGAGGGSIAWIDEAGGLQVGPQSAGADPGPASYGMGGSAPTFTDAALVVGHLGPETPLAGTLALDEDLARKALEPLAKAMDMSIEAFARGVVQISTTKIVGAVRSITVELGRDPKDSAVLAFGGGGGLVAAEVARQLGMAKVIIPPGQGAFSALGMLMADVQHDLAQTVVTDLDTLDRGMLDEIFVSLENEAREMLGSEGFGADRQTVNMAIDLRYAGQEHSVTVDVPGDLDDPQAFLSTTFAEMHEQHYGHTLTDPVQITTFRLSAIGLVDRPQLPRIPERRSGDLKPIGERRVARNNGISGDTVSVYARDGLMAGDAIAGPAVIVEHTATTVFGPADHMVVGEHGELILRIGSES